MDDTITGRILEEYGYRDFTLMPVEKGYRNESHPFKLKNGETLNLILFKSENNTLELIRNADKSSSAAAAFGLPARQAANDKIIKLQGSGSWHKYGKVYNYLPGHTIPWEAYTQGHIKLLGKTLSNLHEALKDVPKEGYPKVANQYIEHLEKMRKYFTEDGVMLALVNKLEVIANPYTFEYISRILQASTRLDNQQVLHMDFVRSNILFDDRAEPNLTGILDFEKTAVGHPTFDIARTLAFLLVDCKYKTETQARKYFLQSGYEKRGSSMYHPITLVDKGADYDLLEVLVDLFLFYDFYKFLRHNPYESLADNEHFVRTKSILLRQGLIRTVSR